MENVLVQQGADRDGKNRKVNSLPTERTLDGHDRMALSSATRSVKHDHR